MWSSFLDKEFSVKTWTIGVDTQWRPMKKMRVLEYLCCEEIWRKLGLFSQEKQRLQGDFLMAFQYMKGSCNKEGDLLSRSIVMGQGATV